MVCDWDSLMPVKSKAQSRALNAKFGHAWVVAHHFDQSTKGLPEHVGDGQKKLIHKRAKHGRSNSRKIY